MLLMGSSPNISEGKNIEIIEYIGKAVEISSKVWMISKVVDPVYNRSFFTLVGTPEEMKKVLFEIAKRAVEKIDMTKHKGEHPRIGAIDVIPLFPVMGINMRDIVEISKELALQISKNLSLPVYLYAYSAQKPSRKDINKIREGEFENLKEKMKNEEWFPDFGPKHPHPTAGATIVGARDFLVTVDFYLDTRDRWMVSQIIRELSNKIEASIFTHKYDGKYIISLNVSGKDLNLVGVMEKVVKMVDYFGCKVEKVNFVTPLTSCVLRKSLENFLKANFIGEELTIEEFVLKELEL